MGMRQGADRGGHSDVTQSLFKVRLALACEEGSPQTASSHGLLQSLPLLKSHTFLRLHPSGGGARAWTSLPNVAQLW